MVAMDILHHLQVRQSLNGVLSHHAYTCQVILT